MRKLLKVPRLPQGEGVPKVVYRVGQDRRRVGQRTPDKLDDRKEEVEKEGDLDIFYRTVVMVVVSVVMSHDPLLFIAPIILF